MKKVGILNFQYSNHNYGAVLQAAALEHICNELGHKATHLDYRAVSKPTVKKRIGKLLRQLGLRKTPKARHVANEAAFERFRQDFITRTQRINSPTEFTAASRKFDVVIVGSDQVWRPAYSKDPITFFLKYVPSDVDRIAYAASFGTSTWEHADDVILTRKIGLELQQFKAISCREESGVAICKDLFDVPSVHVLDPVLVVDDFFYESIFSKSSIKYPAKIVYYKLDVTSDFREDLKVLSSNIGSDAVNLYSKNHNGFEYQEVADWLSLIRLSEVVVTDSFHCVCLALRFGKEVIYCPNDKRGATRLDSLFLKFDLELIALKIKLKTSMFRINRLSDINAILESERGSSLKFLENELSS
jgi:hypothetical protein